MAAKDPKRRSDAASIASYWMWSTVPDRTARTRKARTALEEKFAREVDPDGVMTPQARAQAVEARKKAYYRQLAKKRWDRQRAA